MTLSLASRSHPRAGPGPEEANAPAGNSSPGRAVRGQVPDGADRPQLSPRPKPSLKKERD